MKQFLKYIYHLSLYDFKRDYIGSRLGFFWTIINPLVFISILWFVFSFGLKVELASSNHSFFIWLITGYVPWIFISQVISLSPNSIIQYAFLLKKPSFKIYLIPLIKIFNSFLIFLFLFLTLIIILFFNGLRPSLFWIQIPFYLILLLLLLTPVSILISTLTIFFRDIAGFTPILIQLFFWGSAIIWDINNLPNSLGAYLKLNPVFFIVDGFRDTFLNKVWVFEKLDLLLIYLFFVLIFSFLAFVLFKNTEKYFIDHI